MCEDDDQDSGEGDGIADQAEHRKENDRRLLVPGLLQAAAPMRHGITAPSPP